MMFENLFRDNDCWDILYVLTLQTGTARQKIYDTKKDDDDHETHGRIYHEALTFLFWFVTVATSNKVLEHTPDEGKEANADDKWDKYWIGEEKDIFKE